MLAIILATLLAPVSPAQIEPPDRTVDTVRVTYVERNAMALPRTLYVELNDGSTWRLRPCRLEDSRNCWWDAGTRGNQRGTSFVNLRGTIIHTHRI